MTAARRRVMKEIAMTGRGHEADFGLIMPSAMAALVKEGLYEPWEGTYRITPKGRKIYLMERGLNSK